MCVTRYNRIPYKFNLVAQHFVYSSEQLVDDFVVDSFFFLRNPVFVSILFVNEPVRIDA